MKTPKDKDRGLSLERLRSVLSYDPETGNFVWIKRTAPTVGRIKIGNLAGRLRKDGYRVIAVDRYLYLAHRLVWFYSHERWPETGIDHIDGNPSNNKLSNLREATSSQNHGNMKMFSNNTSGYRGVSLHKCGRWSAEIWFQRRKKYIGLYATKQEASRAYESEHKRLFGEFSRKVA